jgi:hypothetical protein
VLEVVMFNVEVVIFNVLFVVIVKEDQILCKLDISEA